MTEICPTCEGRGEGIIVNYYGDGTIKSERCPDCKGTGQREVKDGK